MIINILELGAKGNSISADTSIIQKAIDACSEAGGGKVVIPKDKSFTIGGIFLKSNVELHLEENSLLMGSGCEEEYIIRPGSFERIKNATPISGLIFSKDCINIKITGNGKIDGNFKKFIPEGQEGEEHLAFFKYPRPMTVYFENCKNVVLTDVTITNAPFWTVHLVGCVDTNITAIKIHNELRMPNTDGIDIDRCKNTIIKDCTIITGDDAICPKCTEETAVYGDCENILVENCFLTSTSSAIKFGSSSFGNFRNCIFTNIEIKESNRGLAFQLRDTHGAENIIFKNIKVETRRFSEGWWGSAEPIYVTCCTREEGMIINKIKNVVFENISCECENGIFIYSDIPEAIDGITLKNIDLNFRRVTDYDISQYDLRPWKGEPIFFHETAPVVAINANNITLENIKLADKENILLEKDYVFKNCKNVIK
jgi:polygalacturonase